MRNSWYVMALCLTASCIGVPLSANGALLFHLAPAPAVLFSALFFGGMGCGTILGGRLADRLPSVQVLLGSCTGVTLASIVLPLWPQMEWILFCRFLLGFWVGSVFVSGARLAAMQPRALLAQGLYGGALQLGVGSGVLLTPFLLSWLQTRGALFFWAVSSLPPIVLWGVLMDASDTPSRHQTGQRLTAALRLPIVWKLGIIHVGTFGLGTGIAVWITVFLVGRYHLPLLVAAALGSGYILAGVIIRPLGGMLVQYAGSHLLQVIQLAVILSALGVTLLIIAPTLPIALGGTALIAMGMNLPYASVLTLAARFGVQSGIGAGSMQGAVIMLLALSLILMPLVIGVGTTIGQPFTASGLLFCSPALVAAWWLRRELRQEHPQGSLIEPRGECESHDLLTVHPVLITKNRGDL